MHLQRLKIKGGWKVEIEHGGRSVSRLWIVDRSMRIGHKTVRVGGIAGVGTDPAHRNKGLASQVLNQAIELMGEKGYDLSFLFGIQDFYPRFGFATCMAERRFSMDTRAAERVQKGPAMRPLGKGAAAKRALEQIRRMHNRLNRARTGAVVRGASWDGFPMAAGFGVEPKVFVWENAKGKVGAYAVLDDRTDRCRAAEVGAESAEGQAAAIRLLARRAVALRRERIQVCMPADSEFALYCRSLGAADETRYERNAGPMARIINLKSTLAKLEPVWRERWPKGPGLKLQTDLGSVRLVRQGGGIRVDEGGSAKGGARMGQAALVQALLGYRSTDDLARSGEIAASRQAQRALASLFPLQEAHMSWPDRF